MSTSEAVTDDGSRENFSSIEKAIEVPESNFLASTQPASAKQSEKLGWLVGDIVWSKIPGHPWWPSMIANEPNTAVYFKYKGRAKYYHVHFFGTEPMRGWVGEKSVLQYKGKAHFLSLRLSVHGKQHKIGNKQLPVWEAAITMADRALLLNCNERQLVFTINYNETKNPTPEHASEKVHLASISTESDSSFEKVCNGGDSVLEPPMKLAKLAEHMLGLNEAISNSSKSHNEGKNTKQAIPKQKVTPAKQANSNKSGKKVKKDEVKNNLVIVNHSPTSCTVQFNMNPKNPNVKRKRGRPRKDLLFVVSSEAGADGVAMAKKSKFEKISQQVLTNNVCIPSVDGEKSDVASDTNSISSIETESRSSRFVLKPKECVCAVCEQPDDLIFCEGVCNNAYHKDCLDVNGEFLPEKFVCDECMSGNHPCFVCGKTSNVIKCSFQNCGKFYHLDCLKTVDPNINDETFMCPLHYCNVCGPSKTANKKRLTCCTRCPVAYHSQTCIVAGSLPITAQYLVCKRHFLADKKKAHHSHVNVNWCFVCSIGGTLICCESCPAAFHAECIDETSIPEGCFFCRDCKGGKELLYGEIVWVKLGMYRWWPAQICNPNNIPTNIQRMQHQPGEFPVQFLGSHDYYWIHRGRVFSYQEGDKGSQSGGKYLAEIFKRALHEAKEKYAEWQKAQEEKAEKDLQKLSKKPAAYKHIKVNRYTTATRYVIDEPEWSTCDCTMDDENPCGPDSHCINRILFVECSPLKCRAKENCQNQCFVKRQDLKCEIFRAERRGWGLRAKADAKKGQFVIEYVGELINEETCRERVRKGSNEGVTNYYMLTIDKDCIIDAGPMGNLSRFMNHSCDPNCETQKWNVNGEVRVGLFAKRDIMAGEELVFDYQLDCLGNEKKKCCCGSENCSGFLGVRPKTQHALRLQEEKKKNQDSKKKKKKSGNNKKNQPVDEHEDECFDCGDGGELIMCSKTGCSKCYHLSCLTIDKVPHGDWLCPWHFCDDCGKAAMVRCHECSNSFCLAHAPGQITKLADGRHLCGLHPDCDLETKDVTPDKVSNNIYKEPSAPVATTVVATSDDTSVSVPIGSCSVPMNPLDEPGINVPTNPVGKPVDLMLTSPTDVPVDLVSVPTNPTDEPIDPNSVATSPTDITTDPISVPTNPTDLPVDLVSVPRNPADVRIDPNSVVTNLTDITSDPISVPTNPTDVPIDPVNPPTNSTNAPLNPPDVSLYSNGVPVNLTKVPKNSADVPLDSVSMLTNPTEIPMNPVNLPANRTDVPVHPINVSANPVHALVDSSSVLANPADVPIDCISVPTNLTHLPADRSFNHIDPSNNVNDFITQRQTVLMEPDRAKDLESVFKDPTNVVPDPNIISKNPSVVPRT